MLEGLILAAMVISIAVYGWALNRNIKGKSMLSEKTITRMERKPEFKPYTIKAYPNANPGPCFEMPNIVDHAFGLMGSGIFSATDKDGREYRLMSKLFIFEIDPMLEAES